MLTPSQNAAHERRFGCPASLTPVNPSLRPSPPTGERENLARPPSPYKPLSRNAGEGGRGREPAAG
jgi:hypothetical protein